MFSLEGISQVQQTRNLEISAIVKYSLVHLDACFLHSEVLPGVLGFTMVF